VEVVASLSQGRTASAQCGLITHKSVPVIFEPPCKYRILETIDYLLIFYLFLNFVHSFARQSVRVLIVNIVGIPTCSQHLLT